MQPLYSTAEGITDCIVSGVAGGASERHTIDRSNRTFSYNLAPVLHC